MIRTLKHTWHDPVTRWELRFLESQHRKPRRWWLALVALPGITAAVLFACHYEPSSIPSNGDTTVYWLISFVLLAYMIGAWIAVSLSATALAKRDPSVMGEHLILTGVTARRLAFARVIALWRHHRRLWLLLLVLHGALAYGTMIILIDITPYTPSLRAFNYATMSFVQYVSIELPSSMCAAPSICRLNGWLHKGTWRAWYPIPPAAAAAAPIAVLILTTADSLLMCAGAALISRIFYRLPALVLPASVAARLLIAVVAFGVMDGAPHVWDDLNAAMDRALTAAGTGLRWRNIAYYAQYDDVIMQMSGYGLHKTPRELWLVRHLLYQSFIENTYTPYPQFYEPTTLPNMIRDTVQLSASGLIDGAYPIANMIRPEDSARYTAFAMLTVAGSAVLYIILIGAQMRIAVWIVRRRGALR